MTMKTRRELRSLLEYLVLACFLVLTMFPLVWMLLTSLEGFQGEIYAFSVWYLPNPASAVNYVAMLWKGNFDRYMLNPFFSSAMVATCAMFIAILVSYVISRFRFRFRSVLLLFFLITQMIPVFTILAPLYQLLAKVKMFSGLRSLTILYTSMMIPFSVIALCGFFDSVPKSLEEAAWIDGYDYFKALFKVMVPVIMPDIMTTSIFTLIDSWDEFLVTVVFIDMDKFKTIPVGFNGLTLKYDIKWGGIVTETIMSLVPTMCLFTSAQKYMIEGLTAGSVKG